MPEYSPRQLEDILGEYLDFPAQAHPAENVATALRVAGLLESSGYDFTLKDLCPKSMDSKWRASFRLGEKEFPAEDAQAAVAICAAAVAALQDRPDQP